MQGAVGPYRHSSKNAGKDAGVATWKVALRMGKPLPLQ
jgi:hypothetical protein